MGMMMTLKWQKGCPGPQARRKGVRSFVSPCVTWRNVFLSAIWRIKFLCRPAAEKRQREGSVVEPPAGFKRSRRRRRTVGPTKQKLNWKRPGTDINISGAIDLTLILLPHSQSLWTVNDRGTAHIRRNQPFLEKAASDSELESPVLRVLSSPLRRLRRRRFLLP